MLGRAALRALRTPSLQKTSVTGYGRVFGGSLVGSSGVLANVGSVGIVGRLGWSQRAFSQGLLPPDGLPLRKLARKWKRKLPALLDGWNGELPPPSVSSDPDIFAAQQRVFGYRDPSPVKTLRKKNERYLRQAAGAVKYIPLTEFDVKRAQMAHLKFERRRLRKLATPEAQEELRSVELILDAIRYTPEQLERRRKLMALKRRGKGPPKKGQGKRSAKAAGKKKK